MVQKIEWTLGALNDLQDIYEYIARDSSRYAQIQIENIQNSVLKLANFPKSGHIVPELLHLPYREILVGNYRIFYKYDEKDNQIKIMAVVHVRQMLKDINF